MDFAFYIARRYLISRSKNNAINIIAGIASAAIIVGAASLFIVLSVFSGLREFSLSFSNDFDPDLKISASSGKSFFITPVQEKKLADQESIVSYSKVIEERVLFMFEGKEKVAFIKGIDQRFGNVNDVQESLFNGQWLKYGTYQAVVGYGIANDLSMGLFDYHNMLEVFVPKPGKGTIEKPEDAFVQANLIPVGVYTISEEHDSKYVFADLALVQELLKYKSNQISNLEVKLSPTANESVAIVSIREIFGNSVDIRTRAQQNDALYKMLNTENIAVYLIFTLVIIIALFNLIGALIMMILDKKSNLKTLLNLGSEIKDLRRIFLFHGTLLTIAGGIIGLFLAVIVVLIQQHFQLVMITESLPYPVLFNIQNFLIVLFTIVFLGFGASWIASTRVNEKLLH